MRARRLAPLLILYVSLDFANPMMPGAVSFDPDDSVEAIRPDRSRVDGDAAPAPPGPAAERLEPSRLVRLAARPAPGIVPPRRAPVLPRLRPARSPDPAPGSDDH
jgi:hypothetical protein